MKTRISVDLRSSAAGYSLKMLEEAGDGMGGEKAAAADVSIMANDGWIRVTGGRTAMVAAWANVIPCASGSRNVWVHSADVA